MPPTAGLDPAKIDFQKYYFYGTILNVPPILAFYPMRTVRILQQRKSSVPVSSSIFTVIKDVQQKNGFRALFAGVTVFSLGLTTTKILQFATYDYTLQQVKQHDHFGLQVLKNPSVLSSAIGMFSAVVTTFFVVPFDMVSQQITIAKAGAQGNIVPAAAAATAATVATPLVPGPTSLTAKLPTLTPTQPMPISESLKLQYKQEGVRFLFRGYVATLMSTVPFFAAYFPAYETSKVWVKNGIQWVRAQQPSSSAPFPPPELDQLLISSIAGSIASLTGVLISSPSDMVKTRIQTEQRLQLPGSTLSKAPLPPLRWMDVFVEIWRKEGFMKFFAGTKARAILAVPGGALNFVIFDFVRSVSIIKEPPLPNTRSQIPVSTKEALC
ncbi:hypothetical protein EMPS_08886 [Entomortierella parvispora]|uniref:Mitochondrial carrier protein n=1 Tax=Entomortierella parvispora TaxID=205924 RepID=A0A9P3HH59_9FUNG|nr:hypothetical protein EMPS_08886 [Entomortierella parvispora]